MLETCMTARKNYIRMQTVVVLVDTWIMKRLHVQLFTILVYQFVRNAMPRKINSSLTKLITLHQRSAPIRTSSLFPALNPQQNCIHTQWRSIFYYCVQNMKEREN